MREDVVQDHNTPVSSADWGPGYQFWQAIRTLLSERGPEGTTSLVRMASHLVIILVAISVLWISRQQLPQWDIPLAEGIETSAELLSDEGASLASPADTNAARANFALVRAAVPITLILERPRDNVITHTVKAGDTLYGIAQKYKLGAETIMFANGLESNPDLLRLGQQLVILPVNGIVHTVKKGDTLEKLAKTYRVTVASIIDYPLNHLDARNPIIATNQKLLVPGGYKEIPIKQVQVYTGSVPAGTRLGTGRFIWPTAGYVTQGYKPYHQAVDIARRLGTPVKAADNGYVVSAGWSNDGYGNYIVIDHGNGYQTLYGHLNKIFVKAKEAVAKGAEIAQMGSTGRSTGPHLHFEIRKNGVRLNPISFLP